MIKINRSRKRFLDYKEYLERMLAKVREARGRVIT